MAHRPYLVVTLSLGTVKMYSMLKRILHTINCSFKQIFKILFTH